MPKNSKWRSFLTYVACFVFPFFGIVYGALETCRGEDVNRRRGKIYIVLGITGLVLVCVGAAVWLGLGLKAGFSFLLPE
ncbi:MAG: hypothetical protein PVH29_05970 [Candidatus Zixiibacteriota bacterium]